LPVICLAPAEELGSRSIHPRDGGGFMMRRWTAIVAMLATIALGVPLGGTSPAVAGGKPMPPSRRHVPESLR
jgi:hypothetical protein